MQDNPDPDSIASAMAFATLIHRRLDKRVAIGYGGTVGRAENAAMIELGSEQTLSGCLNTNLFYDPATPSGYDTALFREVGTTSYDPYYLWWNLDTGQRAKSAFAFLYPSGFVEFAPSGTMAFVQHDVNGFHGGGTNYSLIDLCPAQIGQSSQPGIEYAGVLHAWVVPGAPTTVAFRTEGGATVGASGYVDCTLTPLLGACCMPDGSCSDITQAACTGTWHPEGLCAQVSCPAAALGVSKTGPASVERGLPVTYTLTASNTGSLPATGVVVTDRIPTSSAFVSATAGGTYSAVTSTVTWSLGSLAPGQQSPLGVTVRAPCSGTSLVNDTYAISGTPGGTVAGSPAVTTTLTAPNTTGLSLTLLSTALDPTPLQTGGRVRHTYSHAIKGFSAELPEAAVRALVQMKLPLSMLRKMASAQFLKLVDEEQDVPASRSHGDAIAQPAIQGGDGMPQHLAEMLVLGFAVRFGGVDAIVDRVEIAGGPGTMD